MSFDGVLWLENAWDRALNLLYPRVCCVCQRPIGMDARVCGDCKQGLRYIGNLRCLKCGKPLSGDDEEYCADCRAGGHIYTQGTGVWGYSDGISRSIYQFKYHGMRDYARFYGAELARCCGGMIQAWGADVFVPVPLHGSRYRKRGYNQAALVARQAGRLLGLPVDEGLLVRRHGTRPQKELDEKGRRENLKNAFIISRNVVEYSKVVLVDDIYTTGATVDECSRVLLDAGVKSVYFAALCIGRGF